MTAKSFLDCHSSDQEKLPGKDGILEMCGSVSEKGEGMNQESRGKEGH